MAGAGCPGRPLSVPKDAEMDLLSPLGNRCNQTSSSHFDRKCVQPTAQCRTNLGDKWN